MGRAETLTAVREKYPQYRDLADDELAQGLAAKFPAYRDLVSTPVLRNPPSFTERLLRAGPGSAGLIVGGLTGNPALAGLGYAVGEEFGRGTGRNLELLRSMTPADRRAWVLALPGTPEGGRTRQALESKYAASAPDPPRPGASAREFVWNTALGTAMDAGTRAAGWLLPRVLNPFATPAAKPFADTASHFDIPTTAAERAGSAPLAQVEAFVGRFPGGVGRIQRFREGQREAIETAARRFGSPTGQAPAPSILGSETQAALTTAETQARKAASSLYGAVERAVGPAPVIDATLINEAAAAIVEREWAARGVHKPGLTRSAGGIEHLTRPAEHGVPVLKTGGGRMLPDELTRSDLERLPPELRDALGLTQVKRLTFQQARDLQSRLGSLARSTKDDVVRAHLLRLKQSVTDAVDAYSATAATPIRDQLRAANEFYRREVAEVFGPRTQAKTFVRKMMNERPELVVGLLRRVSDIRAVKQALANDPASIEKLRRGFMDSVITRSADPTTEAFSPQRFLTQLHKYEPEFRRELLGFDMARELDRLTGVLQQMVRVSRGGLNPSETARGILGAEQIFGIVRWVPAAAGAALGYGGHPIEGGLVLMTPNVLARVLTSPRGIRLLSEGLRTPRTSLYARGLAAELAGLARRDEERKVTDAQR